MDINELVRRGKSGDEHVIEDLIKLYKPLIRKTACNYYIHGHDDDDLEQLGNIYLLKALEKYDESMGYNFTVYLKVTLKNNFGNLIRKHAKNNYTLSLDYNCGEDQSFVDYLQDDYILEDEYIKNDEIRRLKEALKLLKEEEREFITKVCLVRGGVKTYRELYGISYRQFRNKKESIIKKLKKFLT